MARVAIIDRDEHSRGELVRSLSAEHDVLGVPDIARAARHEVPTAWEVVVFDAAALADAETDGALLASLQGLEGRPELIIISDQADLALVSQAHRAGAYELLAKPVDTAALKQAVANAAQLHGFRNERRRIDAQNRQQRVELEALVEQRTHQMQQIFANVPAMLFRVVSVRGVRREFTFVSENCEALLELRAADLSSDAARFEALVHPNDRARFLAAREAAEAAGKSLRFEGRFVLPSGRERWLQCVAQPTRLAQGAVAWDGLLVDVSERMELQSQLLLTDRLAVIGTIAAALSHEVNNPLFCVSTSLIAIAEQLSAVSEQVQVHQLIDEALAGIQRIEHTLADLRSFSRATGDGPSSVRVTQVLDASIRLASNEIRHRAQLVRDYRSDPFVVADESSLAQVFLNVLISAAQSIPEGDASSNLLCVAVWNQGDTVQIEISDSSKGSANERLNCALDPDSDTVERLRSGVGLYVSQQLVACMGGEMSAASTERGGNCFRMSLPIVPYAEQRPVLPPLKLVRSRTLRILVIDDEELVVRALSRSLVGHAVTAVTSGREAIDLIRSEAPFDLVLCDVMMPDLTGADVYDAVRAQQAGAEKRIVFVTGGAFTRNAHEFLKSVPNRRIEKPFSRASLDAIINEVSP
jgi:C4-dicarboxylate-specific signal transduction histidine kinase